jgi:hypothetical protein
MPSSYETRRGISFGTHNEQNLPARTFRYSGPVDALIPESTTYLKRSVQCVRSDLRAASRQALPPVLQWHLRLQKHARRAHCEVLSSAVGYGHCRFPQQVHSSHCVSAGYPWNLSHLQTSLGNAHLPAARSIGTQPAERPARASAPARVPSSVLSARHGRSTGSTPRRQCSRAANQLQLRLGRTDFAARAQLRSVVDMNHSERGIN